MVDHLGFIITGITSAANCSERAGLEALLYYNKYNKNIPKKIFADRGYSGKDFKNKIKKYGVTLEVVKKRKQKKFLLEPRRWIVERTFAWLGKFRRLSKEYELLNYSSMAMIYTAMIRIMLRRMEQLC